MSAFLFHGTHIVSFPQSFYYYYYYFILLVCCCDDHNVQKGVRFGNDEIDIFGGNVLMNLDWLMACIVKELIFSSIYNRWRKWSSCHIIELDDVGWKSIKFLYNNVLAIINRCRIKVHRHNFAVSKLMQVEIFESFKWVFFFVV